MSVNELNQSDFLGLIIEEQRNVVAIWLPEPIFMIFLD